MTDHVRSARESHFLQVSVILSSGEGLVHDDPVGDVTNAHCQTKDDFLALFPSLLIWPMSSPQTMNLISGRKNRILPQC